MKAACIREVWLTQLVVRILISAWSFPSVIAFLADQYSRYFWRHWCEYWNRIVLHTARSSERICRCHCLLFYTCGALREATAKNRSRERCGRKKAALNNLLPEFLYVQWTSCKTFNRKFL